MEDVFVCGLDQTLAAPPEPANELGACSRAGVVVVAVGSLSTNTAPKRKHKYTE